jgi:hypothetical protein
MTRRVAWAARGRLLALGAGLLGAGLLGSGLLAGCGASPAPQGPTGIDGLTIPTPSPDPRDFTDHVDNRWFPLEPGTRWTYRRYTPTSLDTVVATVLPTTHRVDGVPTTAVRFVVRRPHGRPALAAVRWYAQDTAGNVWWFGQRVGGTFSIDPLAPGSWVAGRQGARPGLLVPAHPRAGDGFANGFQSGVMERRTTVMSLDVAVALPRGGYHHTIETQDLSELEPALVVQSYFAPGVGLVAQQAIEAEATELTLVRFRRP